MQARNVIRRTETVFRLEGGAFREPMLPQGGAGAEAFVIFQGTVRNEPLSEGSAQRAQMPAGFSRRRASTRP